MTSNGNAYLISKEVKKDIFIPNKNLNSALDKDKVLVEVKKNINNRIIANVLGVISRNKDEFVACIDDKIRKISNGYKIKIKHKAGYLDAYLDNFDIDEFNNKKVLVKVYKWKRDKIFVKIKKSIGNIGYIDTDMNEILLENGVYSNFDDKIKLELKNIRFNISKKDLKDRKDMRSIVTFTIDPIDAKDFDDAISVDIISDNDIQIGVHIADVTHYIKENSLLDKEAFNRAVSIYLPNRVIPMLPEIISNKICSINPREDKFTFSFVFNFDNEGNIKSKWIGKTIINSNKRLDYHQAQKIIDKEYDIEIKNYVIKANEIAKKLREARNKKGFLNISSSDIKFKFDNRGNPIDVSKNKIYDSNKLIEEFMILVNNEISKKISLDNKKKTKNTFIYRVHERPDYDKLDNLKKMMSSFDYNINISSKDKFIYSVNYILRKINDKVKLNIMERIILSSMSKAKYSTKSLGHYALSFDYYTHFTSPIRRYSDILAHRLLYDYINDKEIKKIDYEDKCNHLSKKERVAINIERQAIKYMQLKYIKKHLNKVFYGIISHITEYGFFVELENNMGEGFIKINNRSKFKLRKIKDKCFVNVANKRQYRLFDKVKVKLIDIDLEEKKLYLSIHN